MLVSRAGQCDVLQWCVVDVVCIHARDITHCVSCKQLTKPFRSKCPDSEYHCQQLCIARQVTFCYQRNCEPLQHIRHRILCTVHCVPHQLQPLSVLYTTSFETLNCLQETSHLLYKVPIHMIAHALIEAPVRPNWVTTCTYSCAVCLSAQWVWTIHHWHIRLFRAGMDSGVATDCRIGWIK